MLFDFVFEPNVLFYIYIYFFCEYTQFLGETHESVRTGLWVGDCFIYTNGVNRINYYVGGEIVTVSHLDRTMYLLGYVPRDNR
jgi:coatomer subunit beta'